MACTGSPSSRHASICFPARSILHLANTPPSGLDSSISKHGSLTHPSVCPSISLPPTPNTYLPTFPQFGAVRWSTLTQLEAPHLTATAPLVPPLETTVTGLTFADENLTALANPPVDKKRPVRALPCLDVDTGGKCLPPPPANGIVVCATSGRYPPVKKLKKKKKWTPFEDVAGRLATAVAVTTFSSYT